MDAQHFVVDEYCLTCGSKKGQCRLITGFYTCHICGFMFKDLERCPYCGWEVMTA